MGHDDRFEPLGSGRKAQIYTLQPLGGCCDKHDKHDELHM